MSSGNPYVLIVDSHSSANKGDAAILQALIESLTRELPDAIFKVHSTYPSVAAAMHHIPASPPLVNRPHRRLAYMPMVFKMLLFFVLGVGYRWGLNLQRLLPNRGIFARYKDFLEADLVVGMGGGFYNDNYDRSLPGRLFHLWLGKILQKPVVISAHSIGPFKRPFYRWLAGFVFRQLDLICLRDSESLPQLALMNVSEAKVQVVADSAWLLQPASIERAQNILQLEKVPNSKPLVSVALLRWRLFQTKPWLEGHQQYLKTVVEVLGNLIRCHNCHVVFLSTNTNLGGHPTDDRQTAREALALMDPALIEHTTIIDGEYRPEELKALYGQVALHIGTRMHSVILAAAMQTPVIGIAYEFKMFGVMRSLGLGEYVCDIENITLDDLWGKVDAAFKKRESLRRKIARALPTLQAQARRNAQLIAGVLQAKKETWPRF
ncbi:MAG: polysaccharide pyruvyl transferase family protein [Anaerolineae bacterium]|nr:polysaccharide pyruvyl transferase family protein [Anaerolineae bacterium]